MIHFTLVIILHSFVIIETQHTLFRTGHKSRNQEPHGFSGHHTRYKTFHRYTTISSLPKDLLGSAN